MNSEKTIMICLENMGIGGVETYVINQSIALKKKGYNVLVVANNGVYVQKLKEYGVNFINFEFKNKNYFDYERIKILIDIIIDNKVGQVHINQFSLMTDLLPACLLTNTPYVTYLHTSFSMIEREELNVYTWFEKSYPVYKELFNLLFTCTSKVIAITSAIAEYTAKRYNIEKEKIIIIPNSISFDEYKSNRVKPKRIENVLIIGRLREEKLNSIFAGIDFFKKLDDVFDENLHLSIAGDGPDRKIVEEYLKNSDIDNNKVSFLGAVTDVPRIMEKNDIVVGVDRCILEAISIKKIAIISGYDKTLKGIVDKKNIVKAKSENFSGNNLEEVSLSNLIDRICSLNEYEINDIVEYNYNFAKENLDINKNVYIEKSHNFTYCKKNMEIIRSIILMNNKLGMMNECIIDKLEKNWKEHLAYKNWVDSRMECLENNCKLLKESEENKRKELLSIYSSRTYRFLKKIKSILKR